jgi:signal transduction histidine kinase
MQNTILEMAIKHESEQKEKENQVLVLENRNKKQLIYLALGGCLFLVIILFFILRGYYLKQKSLKKEKTLNELKSQFISTASHEFLTPLTTIITSAELIEKYLTTNEIEKKLNHVNKIKTSVLILKSIFSDFLTQEKIKYGKINNAPQLINIQECVDQIITANYTHFANHKLIYTHTGIIKGAYLDKTIFSTIITNLISNACKYSPIESEITILSNQQENSISISIKDKGIGIPKKDQAFLFEPFYRATNVTNIGGTGLGLNITKKLTTLIGGKLTFTSEENIGTTFNINIPL